jgi:hypothetical protein
MNIFILDEDIETCARYHCDRHVGKMILESTQILCTALNKKGFETPYRSTHINHLCVLWAEESADNFRWLVQLAYALNDEFCYRYDRSRDHASINVLREIEYMKLPGRGLTPFAQAMPEQYRVPGDPVSAYRAFYLGDKAEFATWKKREAPMWFAKGLKMMKRAS